MSVINILKDAWRNRDKLGDDNQSRELAAFLPAALEIQEAPPNPAAKYLGRCLILLFTLGLIWTSLGEVNIVASAEGKIIPSERVKKIQPLDKSVIKTILIHEGQYVTKGQALIELDSTLTQANKQRIEGEMHSLQLRLSVNSALLELLNMPADKQKSIEFSSLPSALTNGGAANNTTETTTQELQIYTRLLWQQWQQYRAQWLTLQSTLAKTQAEKAIDNEIIIKLEQTLPIVIRRTLNLKNLHERGFASEIDYLQLEQERIQQTQDLAAKRQGKKQLAAASDEIHQQLKGLTAQTRTTQLIEITDTQRQLATLQKELAKATDLNNKQTLYAPVSGQVQELTVNTIGGVVMEAQQLMLIVPNEEHLEVEVFLENKDIGFVHEDMPAEIKIHTFPFTKYGVIKGTVTTVSDDAIVDEKRGLIYRMQLSMEKNTLRVENKDVTLSPGMAVTAEIQTGKRRIIEFFMAPLLRYKAESIRER